MIFVFGGHLALPWRGEEERNGEADLHSGFLAAADSSGMVGVVRCGGVRVVDDRFLVRFPDLSGRTDMNRWNIPEWLEREIIERDRCCIYCGVKFAGQRTSRRDRPSWEHIINDARIVNRENIARCCMSCNSSKGTRNLSDWLESDYCRKHGITKDNVAEVVRKALESNLC